MAKTYEVRITCETETGDGKGFHYWRETQTVSPDKTIKCGTHTTAVVRDFAIERKIVTV